MSSMEDLELVFEEVTKKLEKVDDENQVNELRASLEGVKEEARKNPEKIPELIAMMKMMSVSIDDPSAMFQGMGEGSGEGAQGKIEVEIIDHLAETNAAIEEAKATKDVDTLERVLKEREPHKTPLYVDAQKTLKSWKQTRCKENLQAALDGKDIEGLKKELDVAASEEVALTGTNSKGQPFSDALVVRCREFLQMSDMSPEEATDWFIKKEIESRKQYAIGGELDGNVLTSILKDSRVTAKTQFYYEMLRKAEVQPFIQEVEGLIGRGREPQALQVLNEDMGKYGFTEDDEVIRDFRKRLEGVSGGPSAPPPSSGMQMGGPPPPEPLPEPEPEPLPTSEPAIVGMQMGAPPITEPEPEPEPELPASSGSQFTAKEEEEEVSFQLTHHHEKIDDRERSEDRREGHRGAPPNESHEKWFQMVQQHDGRREYVNYWKEMAFVKETKGAQFTNKDPMFANPDKDFEFLKMSGAGVIPKSMIPSFAPEFIKKKGETHIEERQAILKEGVMYYFRNTAAKGAIPIYDAQDIGDVIMHEDEKLGKVWMFTVQTRLPRRLGEKLGCVWEIGMKTEEEAFDLQKLVKKESGNQLF